MPKRWCVEPGCDVLFDAAGSQRCPVHEAASAERARVRRARAAAGRGSASARGYGSVERRRARAVVAEAKASGECCGICLEPCLPDQPIVAHHPDSDAGSGDPATVRLVAAHKWCNDGFRPGR